MTQVDVRPALWIAKQDRIVSTAPPIRFATLEADDGNRISIGWEPRDASTRTHRCRAGEELWLRVHGQVNCDRGNWTFVDPSLEEPEADELVGWLGQRPWPDEAGLKFMEPCLSFFARGVREGLMVLEVRFMGEVSPPWIWDDGDAVWNEGWTLEFAVREHQLLEFARNLERLLIGTV